MWAVSGRALDPHRLGCMHLWGGGGPCPCIKCSLPRSGLKLVDSLPGSPLAAGRGSVLELPGTWASCTAPACSQAQPCPAAAAVAAAAAGVDGERAGISAPAAADSLDPTWSSTRVSLRKRLRDFRLFLASVCTEATENSTHVRERASPLPRSYEQSCFGRSTGSSLTRAPRSASFKKRQVWIQPSERKQYVKYF